MSKPTKTPKTETPVTHGDTIPGTHLRRRYQGEHEVCPEYSSDERMVNGYYGHADTAMQEALDAGFRAVLVFGSTYAIIGGEWCSL